MLLQIPKLAILLIALAVSFASSAGAQSGRFVERPTPTPTPVATPTPPDDQNLRVETEEIKVNISAFDERGRFYAGVGNDDVVISEDNVLHQPTSIRRMPASVLILLDTGGEDRVAKDYKTTRNTAKMLIENLAPDDSVALLEVNDAARIIAEWTNDKKQLYTVLDKELKFGKQSKFVEALQLAVDFFQKSGSENRHLVLITDGLDSSTTDAERNAAILRVLTTDINVHVFSYTRLELDVVKERKSSMVRRGGAPRTQLPPGADIPVNGTTKTYPTVTINTDREMMKKIKQRGEQLENSEKALNELSENTNGIFFLPVSIDEMLSKTAYLARNIDAQYVVTYTPKRPLAQAGAGEVRVITITSKRSGLEILGRRKLAIIKNP
ncbi:MAG: VWA domain-containing protein [Acidobacteria bacterium]|nr:VWA domain-containing protein [Acidobacteriota bacterium]